MQRWGGILFYTFLSESSLPRLLNFRMLPLFQTDSGTGGTDCFFEQFIFFEQFVDWYISFIFLLQFLSNLDFAEKCVLQHLFLLVGHWLLYVLIICSSTCLGMGLHWFFDRHINSVAKCIGEVWIVVVKSPPSVRNVRRNFHVDLRTCYGIFFFL